MENHPDSLGQVQNLKRSLELESIHIKTLERDITRKEAEHQHAKEVFDRLDKDLKDLVQKKQDLLTKHAELHRQITDLQRELDAASKR